MRDSKNLLINKVIQSHLDFKIFFEGKITFRKRFMLKCLEKMQWKIINVFI